MTLILSSNEPSIDYMAYENILSSGYELSFGT